MVPAQDEGARPPFGLTVRGLGRVEVLVVEADEERARELLALAEGGQFRIEEDGDDER